MRLPSPIRFIFCALALLALTAGASRASAESAAVIVVGKSPLRERDGVASAVRSAARSVGWALVEAPLADAEIAKLAGCLKEPKPWDCAASLASARGIHRLIVVSVDPDRSPDGRPAIAMTEQVLLQGASTTAADTRFCSPCVDETLTRIAFELTKRLIEEAAAGTARTTLTIESIPPGAWITLDSTNVGLTNRKYATFPGRHVVILQREGYETETRTVDAVENQDTPVSVTLRPKGGPALGGGSRRGYLISGIVTGVGVAAAGVGIVLQATKEPPPIGEDQPVRLVSAPGIGLMIGGGVVAGVGVYLWLRARGAPRYAPRAVPTATLANGGSIVGWTGRF
jgi:hypothetical protein